MEFLGNGHGDRAAHAAADDADLFDAFRVRRYAQRSYEILNVLALVLVIQKFRRRADDLEDDLDRAARFVAE